MRKNIIITLLGLCCICHTAVADKIEREDVAIGFRGGLNISSSRGSYHNTLVKEMSEIGMDTRFDNEFGGHFGIIADVGITDWFYIQPGIYFTTKSFDFYLSEKEKEFDFSWRRLYELYYLEVPVLSSFRIKLANDFQLQLNAGPFIACGGGGNVKAVILKSELVDIGAFLGNPFVEEKATFTASMRDCNSAWASNTKNSSLEQRTTWAYSTLPRKTLLIMAASIPAISW